MSHLPAGPSSLKWGHDSKTVYAIVWTWPDTPDDESHRKREKEQKEKPSPRRWSSTGPSSATGINGSPTANGRTSLPSTSPAAITRTCSPAPAKRCRPISRTSTITTSRPTARNCASSAKTSPSRASTRTATCTRWRLNQPGAKPVNITADNPANDTSPVYSPDGKSIVFLRQTTKYFYADTRQAHASRTRRRVRGRSRRISSTRSPAPKWMPDGKRLYFETEVKGFHRIGFVGLDNPKVTGDTPPYSEQSMDVATQDRVAVFLESSFDRPPRVFAHHPAGGGKPIPIDHFNDCSRRFLETRQGRKSHVQGGGRQGRADVGRLSARFRPGEEMAAGADGPRRTAQRRSTTISRSAGTRRSGPPGLGRSPASISTAPPASAGRSPTRSPATSAPSRWPTS